jgi:hypothetical protein
VQECSGPVFHVSRALRQQHVDPDMLGNQQCRRALMNRVIYRPSAFHQGGHDALTDPACSFRMAERFAAQIGEHLRSVKRGTLEPLEPHFHSAGRSVTAADGSSMMERSIRCPVTW